MLYVLLYFLAMLLIIAHFSGWLARHNLDWLIMLVGVLVFPAVILL